MPCNPESNSLNPPNFGPPPAGPFGIPFAPPAIPFPDLALPEGIPEDILDLLRNLQAIIPGGKLIPNADESFRKVVDALASLLNQLGPYLALYNFFQALLNIIGCIIDIICCLMNPFCVIRAVRKLFKRCLPDFLNLFPWLALLAMIIALMLLLLALIQYIIEQLAGLIRDLIENIQLLARAVQVDATEDDLTAAAIKIAQLLCLMESLFAILVAFQAILAIIEVLASLAGRSFCGSPGSTGGDDIECCGEEFCPPFIGQNENGLTGTQGRLIYHTRVDNSPLSGAFSSVVLPSIRAERWQFIDEEEQTHQFADIITPINSFIYWPEGKVYERLTSPRKVPYVLDITLNVDPNVLFGHTDPIGGPRNFIIKDIIVTRRPTIGIQIFDDSFDTTNNNGTLRLEGGNVFEADGTTPFEINGSQADLNSFIHFDTTTGAPSSEDGYEILNVSYNLRYNYEILVEEALITVGCVPSVAVERELVNAVIPNIEPVLNLLTANPDIGSGTPNGLPDIGDLDAGTGALGCLNTALQNFRQNVSIENAAIMQAEMETCLNDLNKQALGTYNAAVINGANVFKSTISLDPEIQFVSGQIKVTVVLRDSSGTVISFNVPEESRGLIADLIQGSVTFGEIGDFSFEPESDGFIAFITSDIAGDGELRVIFNNNIFNIVLNQDNDDETTVITENVKTYQFVGTAVRTGIVGEPERQPRRNESDVAGDGD